MLRSWLVAVALATLVGCGSDREWSLSTLRAAGDPQTDAPSMDVARRMDRIEDLIKQGDFPEAQTALDRAFADGFSHPRAFFLQGRLLFDRGRDEDLQAALPWLERALTVSPGWILPRIYMSKVHLRSNQLSAAEEIFKEIDRLAPEHPYGPYGQGYLAFLRQDRPEARRLIAEALKRDAHFAPALLLASYQASQEANKEEQLRYLQRYLSEEPLDAEAVRQVGVLYEESGRLDDARRAYERSWSIRPSPATARLLAQLASRLGRGQEAKRWEGLAQ